MEGGGAGRGAGMVPAHRVAAPRHPDTQRNHLEVSLSLSIYPTTTYIMWPRPNPKVNSQYTVNIQSCVFARTDGDGQPDKYYSLVIFWGLVNRYSE